MWCASRIATAVVEPGRHFDLAVALLVALTGAGCAAGTPKATPLPPVSEIPRAEEEPKVAENPVAAPKPPSYVVIEEGGPVDDGATDQNLAAAARAERERRATAAPPVAVIDDKNLAEHGKGQKLTVVAETPTTPTAASADRAAAAEQDEAYWRRRGLEIRQRWRDAVDRSVRLQSESESLRRRFYSADDPYVRDGQIKPEWDRTLDELQRSRREAETSVSELERFLDDGRRAGALPGWLREGAEIEPRPVPIESPSAEPREPVEAQEPPADPA